MSKADSLRAQLAHAEEEERLEQALADAAAAHRKSGSDEHLAAHDAAAVALTEHRSKARGQGVRVGGDATMKAED